MAAYPDAPQAAYHSPYYGSQKPMQPMAQIYNHEAYTQPQPPSNRSSYYRQQPQSPQTLPSLTSSSFSHHDSVISYPKSPMDSYAPSARSVTSYSLKYDVRKESMATANTAELQKASSFDEPTYPPSAMSCDPEKRTHSPASPRRSNVRNSYQPAGVPIASSLDLQSKAFSILLYLSTLNSLVSTIITFWTMFALLLSAVLIPLRLATLHTLTHPPLRLQLQLIYSSHVHPDTAIRPGAVILVHLLSPLIAFVLTGASWVVALFWFFSAVLGDPAGKDGHNDGKAAVLWVRGKWERWLRKGLVERRSPYSHV